MSPAEILRHPLPLLLEPGTLGCGGREDTLACLLAWLRASPQPLEDWVHEAGAVLLRGFGAHTPDAFRSVCTAIGGELRGYVGGDSPRHAVAEQVYTSTEYPAHLAVLLHNELSYAGWSPRRVFFGCLVPARSGGETPVADGRTIYARLDPALRARFETRGVTYLQHLWDGEGPAGPGKSWQQTFETGERREAERYLRDANMDFEWTDLGLRTAATHRAVLHHPVTGERCWFNQADQWHRDLASVKDSVPGSAPPGGGAGIESLGNHVTFADGSEIDVADLLAIRQTLGACEVCVPWQAGDVLVLDNILAMHGRKPFTGERKVLVAMA